MLSPTAAMRIRWSLAGRGFSSLQTSQPHGAGGGVGGFFSGEVLVAGAEMFRGGTKPIGIPLLFASVHPCRTSNRQVQQVMIIFSKDNQAQKQPFGAHHPTKVNIYCLRVPTVDKCSVRGVSHLNVSDATTCSHAPRQAWHSHLAEGTLWL